MAKNTPAQSPAPTAPVTPPTPGIEAALDASQADNAEDASLEALLRLTQGVDAFKAMLAAFTKSKEGKVVSVATVDFLPWGLGAFRLAVDGAEMFEWEDNEGPKSCPVLLVTVLDSTTKAGKALVSKPFRVSVHWAIAAAFAKKMGAPAREAMAHFKALVRDNPARVKELADSMLVFVACDEKGTPIRKKTKDRKSVV